MITTACDAVDYASLVFAVSKPQSYPVVGIRLIQLGLLPPHGSSGNAVLPRSAVITSYHAPTIYRLL